MTEEKNTNAPERPLDVVVRLRCFEASDELGNGDFSVCRDAADEIVRLRKAGAGVIEAFEELGRIRDPVMMRRAVTKCENMMLAFNDILRPNEKT